jgi:hypothetical protein
MSDTAEFTPKQRELARKLLLERSRSNTKIQFKKLVFRREFSSFSVSRLKVLFKNELRNIEDEARRMQATNNKMQTREEMIRKEMELREMEVIEMEKMKRNELLKKTETLSEALHNVKRKSNSEVQRIRDEAEEKVRELERIREEADEKVRKSVAEVEKLTSRLTLVTKTIEELEREKEVEMTRIISLYEEERLKNMELSSQAKDAVVFRSSVELDHKIKELAKDIGNRDSTEGWIMRDMRKIIQKEVCRLRRAGFKLFKIVVQPDDYLYENDINTNIQNWWDERCELSHKPNYCDIMDQGAYQVLTAVVSDMIDQVSDCRRRFILK